jgi:hypothetical protein
MGKQSEAAAADVGGYTMGKQSEAAAEYVGGYTMGKQSEAAAASAEESQGAAASVSAPRSRGVRGQSLRFRFEVWGLRFMALRVRV